MNSEWPPWLLFNGIQKAKISEQNKQPNSVLRLHLN